MEEVTPEPGRGSYISRVGAGEEANSIGTGTTRGGGACARRQGTGSLHTPSALWPVCLLETVPHLQLS